MASSAEDGHDVRSVTKSVVSALVGIALADGAIESLDQTVGELLRGPAPRRRRPAAGRRDRPAAAVHDVRAARRTTRASVGTSGSSSRSSRARTGCARILGLPLAADPGSEFAYSSATSHLLVGPRRRRDRRLDARLRPRAPVRTTGHRHLGRHVRAHRSAGPPTPSRSSSTRRAPVAWPTDPQGYHFGGAFLKLPTRDLAKFGFLYLNDGRWDGEQVIPADYVRDSTSPGERTPDGAGRLRLAVVGPTASRARTLLRARVRRTGRLRRPGSRPRRRRHQRSRDGALER